MYYSPIGVILIGALLLAQRLTTVSKPVVVVIAIIVIICGFLDYVLPYARRDRVVR